ncbi:MAG: hypothetical protein HUJ73_03245 [Eubacterium sp.]|nr:hypothetical protein [Eubacterium sp.]
MTDENGVTADSNASDGTEGGYYDEDGGYYDEYGGYYDIYGGYYDPYGGYYDPYNNYYPPEDTVYGTEGQTGEDLLTQAEMTVTEDGEYSSKYEVAAYIHLFGHLPSNYITKKEAQKLGWVESEENLWVVAPGKSIGGGWFGNYEHRLPTAANRAYQECDIDFDGTYRNYQRIVYSNDGLIYYTEDFFNSFEKLYGDEETEKKGQTEETGETDSSGEITGTADTAETEDLAAKISELEGIY